MENLGAMAYSRYTGFREITDRDVLELHCISQNTFFPSMSLYIVGGYHLFVSVEILQRFSYGNKLEVIKKIQPFKV